jgi:hypothetical protein
MEFHLNLDPPKFTEKLQLREKILLTGSCFTEHITKKLADNKFTVFENPHGILFNPISICQSLHDCIEGKTYTADELFEDQGLWANWNFHSRFSNGDKFLALDTMNRSIAAGSTALKESSWLIITLGSAFVYQLSDGHTVSNCHKVPAKSFTKRLLSVDEVLAGMDMLFYKLSVFNPSLKIIFTISPVRHVKDGLIENNRSKSVLIQAVHHMVEKYDRLFYFPAYELVIDDLRDYRFYAEDMVHPNYQATNYVWEKFIGACIHESSREIMKEVALIRAAMMHSPQHPESANHQLFLKKYLELTFQLARRCPYLDFTKEIKYFSNGTAETITE